MSDSGSVIQAPDEFKKNCGARGTDELEKLADELKKRTAQDLVKSSPDPSFFLGYATV